MASFFDNLIDRFTKVCLRFPWVLLVLSIGFCGITLNYTYHHLGINTNTAEMLSPDLPFQKNQARIDKAFPQNAYTTLFVVEAETPEETTQAATKLTDLLRKHPDRFTSAYIPNENEFFNQHALLYLELNDLEEVARKLTDAQPFIGHLAQNYHLEGLLDIISLALNKRDQALPMDLNPLLAAIDKTLTHQLKGEPRYLSWQSLLAENKLNTESRRTIVIAKPKLDFSEMLPAERAQTKAREIRETLMAENPSVKIRITGEVALEHEELETVSQSATFSGVVSLVLVCIIQWIGLRSVKLLIATYIVLVMGLIFTAGFAAVTVGHLNIISIAFASLYIGLGVDYAVHICLYYRERKAEGSTNTEAILYSLKCVGSSLLLCALVTALGFFAFIPTDYKGVSELGIISGGGIFIGLLISLIVLPALFCVFPVRNPKPIHSRLMPAFIVTFPFHFSTKIRIVSLLLGLISCLVLTKLTFDANPINLRDPESESVSTIKELLKSKTESPFALTALAPNLDDANKLAAKMQELPAVHDTITLSSFVAKDQDEKLAIIEDLNLVLGNQLENFNGMLNNTNQKTALTRFNEELKKAIIEKTPNASLSILQQLQQRIDEFLKQAESTAHPIDSYMQLEKNIMGLLPYTLDRLRISLTATPFGLADLPASISSHWVSKDGLYRVLITPEKDQNIPENLKEFVAQAQSVDEAVSGLPVANEAGGAAVVKAFIEAFSAAFIAIVLVLLIIYRSIKHTALIIVPLLLAALLTGATNVILNNPFNFANIIALPLLLGMGIDSSILIMHKLHFNLDESENLLQTSTTRGIIFSSLTTLCSFSSLIFTTHRGLASMGLLLSIGLFFTVICSLIVLPAFSGKRI